MQLELVHDGFGAAVLELDATPAEVFGVELVGIGVGVPVV